MEFSKNTDRNAALANMFNESNRNNSRPIDDPLIDAKKEGFDWSDHIAMLSAITGNFSHNASPDTQSVAPAAEIIGTNGNDILIGLDDVGDTLNGRLGDDQLFGGSGKYTDWASYVDAPSAVTVNLATGTASGGDGNDTLNGIEGIIGSSHNDTLIASDDGDQLKGGDGHDTLTGGNGHDWLDGGDGDDTLTGGEGHDNLTGGDGDDVLQGGNGFDWADYWNAPSAVTVNLAAGTASGGDGNDTLNGIEGIEGSSHNDTLIASDNGGDHLSGHNGHDTLIGGDGYDFLSGGDGDDTLTGGDGSDGLFGGAGNDTLIGGEEEKTFDWAYYWHAPSAVTVNLAVGTASGGDGNDTLSGIEGIVGSSHNDTLIASDDGNSLEGGSGHDTLTGGDGSDNLTGGDGDDVLQGGKGFDWASYLNAPSAVTVNLTAGTASGGDGNDTLSDIEAIFGSSHNDTLIGNDDDNQLNGLDGDDMLQGGDGFDWADYRNAPSAVTVNLDAGTASGGDGNDTLSEIEGIFGSGHNDTLTGDAGDNYIFGWNGNDTLNGSGGADTLFGDLGNDKLNGGGGADTLYGGPGKDTYRVNHVGDTVIEYAGEGVDRVNSKITYTLPEHVENLTLTGTATIDGTGNDLANRLNGNSAANQLNGGGGNDRLDGKAGADTMSGGLGNDRYTVDDAGDIVIEGLGEGNDRIYSSVTTTLPDNVEQLILTGASAIDGIGNSKGNKITGNTVNNHLDGGAGNDTLDGGTGTNILTGGAGRDKFNFTTTGHIDTITDFDVPKDTIQLDNAVFTALTSTGTLAADQFVIGTVAVDANDFIIYDDVAGALLYDADGNGAGAAGQIAVVGASLSMTNADIVVI